MASNIPVAQLPPVNSAWFDPKTGLPTKEFALFMQALNGAFLSINSSLGGIIGLSLLKANNLSDVASVVTSRANLGLGAAALLGVNAAGGVPVLDGSSRYPAFDGSQITNLTVGQPAITSSSYPVGTFMMADAMAVAVANNASTAGSNLNGVISDGGTGLWQPNGVTLAGTWKNVSGVTLDGTGGGGSIRFGMWVRTA